MTNRILIVPMLLGGVLSSMAQQKQVVNSSRSNVKNNIEVVSGKDGKLHCTVAGKPCTETEVKQLAGFTSSAKSGISKLALAGPDGTLVCETAAGKPCGATHATELNNGAAAMQHVGDGIGNVGVGLGSKSNPSNPSK